MVSGFIFSYLLGSYMWVIIMSCYFIGVQKHRVVDGEFLAELILYIAASPISFPLLFMYTLFEGIKEYREGKRWK